MPEIRYTQSAIRRLVAEDAAKRYGEPFAPEDVQILDFVGGGIDAIVRSPAVRQSKQQPKPIALRAPQPADGTINLDEQAQEVGRRLRRDGRCEIRVGGKVIEITGCEINIPPPSAARSREDLDNIRYYRHEAGRNATAVVEDQAPMQPKARNIQEAIAAARGSSEPPTARVAFASPGGDPSRPWLGADCYPLLKERAFVYRSNPPACDIL